MNTSDSNRDCARLEAALRNLQARLDASEFDRRTWKSGFLLMNLIVACYIAFCLVSGNTLHG